MTDKVPFLLELDLLEPLNEANLKLKAAERALERVKSHPQPEGMSSEIWSAQLKLVTEDYEAAKAAAEAAKAAVDEETLVVTLQAVSNKVYFALAAEHPPTEEQVAQAEEMAELGGVFEGLTETQRRRMKIDFNPETYPRALVTLCSDLDEEELGVFFDPDGPWTQDDRAELFNRSLAVCQRASILRR